MENLLFVILALLPFVLLFALVVFRKWPAVKAMPLTWFVTVLIVLVFWQLDFLWIGGSFVKGIFISLEIMLIIFGAVWVIEILKEKKHMGDVQNILANVSRDARIQAIIIAWFFGSLIEGIAGFGIPAALTAPLLVSLGFAPVLAVVLSLISNSTAVSFGAAGTPILLGLGGLGIERTLLEEVSKNVAVFHAIAGLLIPLALVWFVVSAKNGTKKDFLNTVPFAIFAWLVFIIPYLLTVWFIGPELPSIIAGFVGLIVVGISAHFGFLTPKKVISFSKNKQKPMKITFKNSFFGLLPYLLIVVLLTLSRIIPFVKENLMKVNVGFDNIFGLGLEYNFLPLFTPSFYFILSGIVCLIMFKASNNEVGMTLKRTWKKVSKPLIALIFALALVQLLIVSGNNNLGLESIPLILAQGAVLFFNKAYFIIAPFIGSFGSFIAGSNTVSNLLFGMLQSEAADALGFSLIIFLALQVVGGAIGNMIAIHNILAASATVGISGQEGKIIRKTIWVMLIYGLIVAFVAGLILFFV